MAAPTKDSIKGFLVASFLSHALDDPKNPIFVKQVYDSNGKVAVDQPLKLSQDLEKLIEILAEGLANQWSAWQTTQSVFTVGITTGTSVTTTPGPTALP